MPFSTAKLKFDKIPLAVVLVIFLVLWTWLAVSLPPWSDEQSHISSGKGLVLTGKPVGYDLETGKLDHDPYIRGLAVSRMAGSLMSMGFDDVALLRLIPFFFTLLTLFAFLGYVRVRFNAPQEWITAMAFLFLSQSFVLEKSLFIRFYAPLGSSVIIGLIGLWETYRACTKRRWGQALAWFAAVVLAQYVPTKEHWQIEHLLMFVMGIMLFHPLVWKIAVNILRRTPVLYLLCIAALICGPFLVLGINEVLKHLSIGTRLLGSTFVTYWDNMAGLIRWAWAISGGVVILIGLARRQKLEFNFFAWLMIIGFYAGLFIGLFNPHNFIFYSRYFYIPVIIFVLGLGGMCWQQYSSERRLIQRGLIVYVILSVVLSVVNLTFDRSNIRPAISWLEQNFKSSDQLITFKSGLLVNGGEKLVPYIYPIRASVDRQDVADLMRHVAQSNGKVYYLYEDSYWLREILYRITTGQQRTSPSDLFRYLKEKAGGIPVIPGLRGCGLLVFEKEILLTHLNQVFLEGFSAYRPVVSWHKQILKKFVSP